MSAARFLAIQSVYAIGAGETEAIVLAEQHGAHLCCDDGKGRRIGRQLLDDARVTGSIGLLVRAVEARAIAPDAAFEAYCEMVAAGGFLPQLGPDFFAPH